MSEQKSPLGLTADETIDPQAVERLFFSVLTDDGEIVEGITGKFMLNLEALASHREAVRAWVKQLPISFHRSKKGQKKAERGGDGFTFLALGQDNNAIQWTGEHRVMEFLYLLAAGLGMARFCMPRDMWSVMPGGVPYIVFDPEGLA